MTIYIVAVHMSQGGQSHEHIEEVKWKNYAARTEGRSPVSAMVEWIDSKVGTAKVTDGVKEVVVYVVRPQQGRPYLQTAADGRWTNNLLALPRY